MGKYQFPTARHTIAIIMLGLLGLIGTFSYLTWDLKMSSYRSEHWIVQNRGVMVDTLHVVIHPQSMVLPSDLKKDFRANKDITYESLYFTYNIPFLIWVVLIAVTVGTAMALLPIIFRTTSNIYQSFGQKPKNIMRAGVLTLLIGSCMTITNSNKYVLMLFTIIDERHTDILLRHPHWIEVLISVGLTTGLFAMGGQLLINDAIGTLPDGLSVASRTEQFKAVEDFMMLRNGLKFYLSVDAALIVLSIVTTDTLRRAIMQEVLVTGTNNQGFFHKSCLICMGWFSRYIWLFFTCQYTTACVRRVRICCEG